VARTVCLTVVFAVTIPFAYRVATVGAQNWRRQMDPRQMDYQSVADGFAGLGIQQGDRMAILGETGFFASYARHARFRVVAEIPDSEGFWHLSGPELELVEQRLASIGLRAIVAVNRPAAATPAEWKEFKISDSRVFGVLLLPPVPADR